MGPTTQLLGFTPSDRFDEGEHGELCATDYTDHPEVYPRRWRPATPTTAGKGREESEETDKSDNEMEVVELKALLGDEQALFRPIEPAE